MVSALEFYKGPNVAAFGPFPFFCLWRSLFWPASGFAHRTVQTVHLFKDAVFLNAGPRLWDHAERNLFNRGNGLAETKTCVRCSAEFPKSGRRKFCSDACKQAHYRYRNKKRYDTDPWQRPILRYYGGKFRLSSWIQTFFPEHETYVEPFCGAAGVLRSKPRSPIEVLNDRNRRLTNLLRTIANPCLAKQIAAMISETPYSHHVYYEARDPHPDPVVDATRMIILGHMGHGSTAAAGGKLSGWRRGVRTAGSHSAKEWSLLPAQIPLWTERLRGVYLENDDAFRVLKCWDRPTTLFYVDPPYLLETRTTRNGYRHDMEESDHKILARTLNRLNGFVVLSGYPSALYESLYPGWTRIDKKALADAGRIATECVWLSPRTATALFESGVENADLNQIAHP